MDWYKQAQSQDMEVYKLVGVVKFVVEHWKTVKGMPDANLESMVFSLNSLESHLAQYEQHASRKMQEANDAVKNWQFANPVNPPSKNIESQPTPPPAPPVQ
jgi:hypothetical protein